MDPTGHPLCLRQMEVSVGPAPALLHVAVFFFRQPQSEQPQIPAPESSRALCPGGKGMPGGGPRRGHHATGKDMAQPLAPSCWDGEDVASGLFPSCESPSQKGVSLSQPRSVHQVALLFCLVAGSGVGWALSCPGVSVATSAEKAILELQTQNGVPFHSCTHHRYNLLFLL